MRAEIIAVGSELLTPTRVDTNSLFLTRRLNECGLRVLRKVVVGDRPEDIRESLLAALRVSEVIILTGGLGPTNDDLTREVVSETLGRQLSLDPGLLESLQNRYSSRGMRMTPNNQRQATVPEGAQVIQNPNGSAPGIFIKEKEALIFLLPGPPHELQPMSDHVITLIKKHKKTSREFFRRLKLASVAESRVDAAVGPIYKEYPSIETTILSSPGIIELFFYWLGDPQEELAEEQLEELSRRVREKMGASVFTDEDKRLEDVVGEILRLKAKTLATAESCTGGWLGKLITDVAGSSDYYRGGIICYSDNLKTHFAGVSETMLERFGAVSEPIAEQLAQGIRLRGQSDLGVSITGIAGPGGGSAEKPVGLVFIGLSTEDETAVKRFEFPGPREAVRLRACRYALDWVRKVLKQEGKS